MKKVTLQWLLFKYTRNTSDELSLNKGEYLIVTNWNVGDGYDYDYKRNDLQQKGNFPSPLVRKISENKGFFLNYLRLRYMIFIYIYKYVYINIKIKKINKIFIFIFYFILKLN